MNTGSESPSPRTFQQWLAQGELLYGALLKECEDIEAQIGELENQLAAKHAEVNQIAGLVGKPPVEGNRRLSAQLVTSYAPEASKPASPLARSLASHRIPREPLTRPPVVREHVPPHG